MKQLFAVVRGRGAAWNRSAPLEEQSGWPAHAAFTNGLAAEGFFVLGGPLEDNDDTLLVFLAETEGDIRARRAADPWSEDMLPLLRLAPWRLRLGEHRLD